MEVCFVDVGQGSSSVILLGGRRAIVIDAGGQQALTVIRLLQHFHVEIIERLIVTHNHDDHSRGAATVLTAFSKRIQEVWCVYDDVLLNSLFFKRLTEEVKSGALQPTQLRRLERDDRPRPVYETASTYLHIVAPTFLQNVQAVADRNANSTSGILLFGNGTSRVIFAGDSTIPEWEGIMKLRTKPFKCDLITTPHHAGGIWGRKQNGESQAALEARIQSSLDWLYSKAINTKYGIVSVGTNNSYGHPRAEVMAAMRRAGVLGICTQMTRQCADDLEAHRRKGLPIVIPSRSVSREDINSNGNSRNVPCAATILVELQSDKVVIQRLSDHQAMIDRLTQSQSKSPLCRN